MCTKETSEPVQSADRLHKVNYNYQGRCQELEAQVDAIKELSRKVGVWSGSRW